MKRFTLRRLFEFDFISALSIFLGAFLVFLVQPIMGKTILPWFGGSPAVWTTCMLFFQVLLLGGYFYAAVMVRFLKPYHQIVVHVVLLTLSLLLLPITPSVAWKPQDGNYPTWRILMMLIASVGGPYFLLSATSPLIQVWFAHVLPSRSPYRLYTLSNIGSLGALLMYPFIIEPNLSSIQQGALWSAIFVAMTVATWWMVAVFWRSNTKLLDAGSEKIEMRTEGTKQPTKLDRILWFAFPTLASMMLLAVTNHVCQDVAVIPFLWIAPLALYLISLIICFDNDAWYLPRWFALGGVLSILLVCDLSFLEFLQLTNNKPAADQFWSFFHHDIRAKIAVYFAAFFMICMICHGETVRRRPASARLTEFYLSVAAGGALGGVIVAVACPYLFSSFAEFKIGIVLSGFAALGVLWHDGKQRWFGQLTGLVRSMVYVAIVALAFVMVGAQSLSMDHFQSIVQLRNFYGVLAVREWTPESTDRRGRMLYHGAILHGFQFASEAKSKTPTTYYTENSGVGRTLKALRRDRKNHVGVVGLGIGTLAAYGQAGDRYRFYEINPNMIELARSPYTFLSNSRADITIISGDARLSLEREEPQNFDCLVLDAFSGDAIPIHLLTRECMELYLHHLNPNGVIAIHVSNQFVDLVSVVSRQAAACGLEKVMIVSGDASFPDVSPSDWILLARDPSFFEEPEIRSVKKYIEVNDTLPIWTDQYNNLFQTLRRPGS